MYSVFRPKPNPLSNYYHLPLPVLLEPLGPLLQAWDPEFGSDLLTDVLDKPQLMAYSTLTPEGVDIKGGEFG